MVNRFDVAVVGSGFAGSLLAMIARRLGRSVVLLERARHPRFVIGESSTPLANLLVEELAKRYGLPRLLPFTKWGPWQRSYPGVTVGLKRGFSFAYHALDRPFQPAPDRRNELQVAASPRDEIADTHWYRADLDAFWAGEACQAGAELWEEFELEETRVDAGGVDLRGRHRQRAVEVRAQWVFDASGPRGFLFRSLRLGEDAWPNLPPTQTVYTHFRGVRRWDELHPSEEMPPYPFDDAAVHHLFPGGWIWLLRFGNGVTSAGALVTRASGLSWMGESGETGWRRLLDRLPSVGELFREATPVLAFRQAENVAFRAGRMSGPQWALAPSAAGFVDPLLSTGFPLTLLGVERLARALEEDWQTERWLSSIESYVRETWEDLLATEQLVGALYKCLEDFDLFVPVTLLYFAAASFSETLRRLGRWEPRFGFLLRGHPRFGDSCRACLAEVLQGATHTGRRDPAERTRLIERIRQTILPVDVAGLTRPDRERWYPVLAEDLFANAAKVGATREELAEMLRRAGFCP